MLKKLIGYALVFLTLCASMTFIGAEQASAADPAPSWRLIEPKYDTIDTFVAAYNVADYGATGDGVTDVTAVFQQLLDSLFRLGGGTLFVPEGKYVIRGNLEVPKGVTLRGEWSKPVKGEPVKGTILMAYAGRGDEEATPFMTMVTSSAVRDMAIWYPEQLPDSIAPYPPAILFGKPNYFGNEFANAKNITLVNAYSGVIFSRKNGGTAPVIQGIYGTPLSRGIEIDNIVDVGRIDFIDLSPAYWAGSGLPNSPAVGSAYEKWIYDNGTGIVMRRNDWSYTGFITVEGYSVGFLSGLSKTSEGASANGHNYGLHLIKCKTGIRFEGTSDVGVMFTNVNIEQSESGIVIDPNRAGTIQLSGCTIDAVTKAIAVDATSTTKVLMQQCTINSGAVDMQGGTLVASDSDFNNAAPQIVLGTESRGNIIGNRFKEEAKIENNSRYITIIKNEPTEVKKLPVFPDVTPEEHKPARMALYVVTDAPFNAKNDGNSDNTAAIQSALDKAEADGGGVVFLPPGKYKVLGHLTVPTGVELKGSVDNSTVPTGPGSTIEVYADRDNESGEPFLKLSADAGIRGLTFNYPEQVSADPFVVAAYPYMIQVTGSNAYIINVGIRAVYNGIDLFTYKTDNHYIDFVAGHVFHNAIKAGGGSTGGKIYNLQFNTLVYAAGSESKFGGWANSPKGNNSSSYDYGAKNLNFLVLGDVSNETLYNDFHYGSYKGVTLTSENGKGPSGVSLGLGVDGSTKSMVFEGLGEGGIDFINTQIVSIGAGDDTRYFESSPTYSGESTFFSIDLWGSPKYALELENGTIGFQLGNFANSGEYGFGKLNAGKIKLDTTSVSSSKAMLNAGKEPQFTVQTSIITPTGITFKKAAAWTNNLTVNPFVVPVSSKSEASESTPSASAAPAESAAVNAGDAKDSSGGNAGVLIGIISAIVIVGAVGTIIYRKKKLSNKA
ncbi:glycosyl hydrolase family 28-related protein [Cohnella yongneupensis]|uniref:Glycosyl hydrolase family 28-related protein n=1 Tax=Cohnella yongneupensis TaxID=425006 RepID=A0ABW0R0S7_9BACL